MIAWLTAPSPIPRWLHIAYGFIAFTGVCQMLFGVPA